MEAARARTDALAARLRTDFPVIDQREVGIAGGSGSRRKPVGSLPPGPLAPLGGSGRSRCSSLPAPTWPNLLLARAVSASRRWQSARRWERAGARW